MAETLTYPTARDLDTIVDDGTRAVDVYLDPTVRRLYVTEGDRIPTPAWYGRHAHICTVPREADGESVLIALYACDAEIRAYTACYVGDYCDGGTLRGRWSDERDARAADMEQALDRALLPASEGGYLRTAQDALDWLATVHMTWAELCEAAGVDPERRDDDAVRAVVKRVESVAWVCGAILVNTERAVRRYLDHADD